METVLQISRIMNENKMRVEILVNLTPFSLNVNVSFQVFPVSFHINLEFSLSQPTSQSILQINFDCFKYIPGLRKGHF